MFRSGKFTAVVLAGLCCAGSAYGQQSLDEALEVLSQHDEAGEAVAGWLERHDLVDLLAVHLEQQIEATTGRQQEAIILELADIYSRLLESTTDPARKELLQVRARRLLTLTDGEGSEQLRLSLLRVTYRTAERVAEQHRLRLATEHDLAGARQTFRELVPQLAQLNDQLERDMLLLERRLAESSGASVGIVSGRVEALQRLHQQCSFLTAWAMYHDAWLNDEEDSARAAEEQFAKLLLADTPRPRPDEISVDLRSAEAYARAILGMGLCRSLTASSATALSWIELLDHERAYEPLREEAIIWKIVVHLEHQEYPQVVQLLRSRSEADGPLPVIWMRLIAVHALEAPTGTRGAAQLVRLAVTQLAVQGELDQIHDIALRYGVEALGDSGFASQYINGLMVYQQARQRHQDEQPGGGEEASALYQEAVDLLSAALEAHDIEQYEDALGGCRRLMGWALYFQERYVEAHEAFLAAEAQLPDEEAAEALWMAIASLDELVLAGEGDAVRDQQSALVQRFLKAYPDSPRVSALLLREALAAERLDDAMLDRLREVPPDHVLYDTAARRAALEMYQRYRQASGEEKVAHAEAYLAIARELLEYEAEDDQLATGRLMLEIRRVLEVSLHELVEDQAMAYRAMQRSDGLRDDGLVLEAELEDELTFRRVQIHLLEGDVRSALILADELWEADDKSRWARLAARSMFRFAHKRRPVQDVNRLELIARHGGRVIREFEDEPDALQRADVLSYHAAVADAMNWLWKIDGEEQDARAALFLYQRMLKVAPRNGEFLKAAAGLATALDDLEFAADCWRRIASGTRPATEPWYEARYELIAALAQLDRDRAREVMAQHVQLYPEYGPEPWGPRLRELAFSASSYS